MKTPSIFEGQDILLPGKRQAPSSVELQRQIKSLSRRIEFLRVFIGAFPNNRWNDKYYKTIGELCDKRASLQIQLETIKEREVSL